MLDADPLIRRLQAGAAVWCSVLAAGALLIWPRRLDVAAGIVGGGLLTAVSFFAIKSSIDGGIRLIEPVPDADPAAPGGASALPGGDQLMEDAEPTEEKTRKQRRQGGWVVVKVAGRYGLLALLAYVMISRLRLHPVGLVVGASALVASASLEAARWLGRQRPSGR